MISSISDDYNLKIKTAIKFSTGMKGILNGKKYTIFLLDKKAIEKPNSFFLFHAFLKRQAVSIENKLKDKFN